MTDVTRTISLEQRELMMGSIESELASVQDTMSLAILHSSLRAAGGSYWREALSNPMLDTCRRFLEQAEYGEVPTQHAYTVTLDAAGWDALRARAVTGLLDVIRDAKETIACGCEQYEPEERDDARAQLEDDIERDTAEMDTWLEVVR